MSPKSDGNSGKKRKASEERRARIEAAKAAERRRARRGKLVIGTVVGVVLVLIAVGVAFTVAQHDKHVADQKAQQQAQDQAFITTVTSLPAATFNSIGTGAANPQAVPAPISGGTAMTADGKPRVLYIGAEYCPYCAMERWSLVAALSRFGTFTGLAGAVSTANDNPSNIPTMTFLNAKYTSQYLSLATFEEQDRDGNPLQTVPAADMATFGKLSTQRSIPFIDFGGLYLQNEPSYDGTFLSGESSADVAKALGQPSSQTAKAIIGGANVTTAQLCVLTKGSPADVCSSAGVVTAAKTLKAAPAHANTTNGAQSPPSSSTAPPSTPASTEPTSTGTR